MIGIDNVIKDFKIGPSVKLFLSFKLTVIYKIQSCYNYKAYSYYLIRFCNEVKKTPYILILTMSKLGCASSLDYSLDNGFLSIDISDL